MSGSPKPRGGSNSELTRLKALWRTLADDARHYWRSRFASSEATQEQLRAELHTKLKVHLRFDSQLTSFRQWVEAQDAMDAESERQAEDDSRARELHPEWSDDQRRMYVINCSLNRAITTGDLEGLGLKAAKLSQAEESGRFKAELEKEKLSLAKLAEARAADEFKLARDKFEFDAAKAAIAQAAKLKTISSNKSLTEEDKVNRTRQILFGVLPK